MEIENKCKVWKWHHKLESEWSLDNLTPVADIQLWVFNMGQISYEILKLSNDILNSDIENGSG